MTTTDGADQATRVWDLPTRLFHWLLVLSFVAAYVTAQLGPAWMDWHFRAGYLLATLLLFRLVWGVVGSDSARFSQFLRGPRSVYRYLRGHGIDTPHFGHNPAGGWMVVIMLVTLMVISVSGFFADDLILFSGPLAACVPVEARDLHSRFHVLASYLALVLIGLHLLAIAVYTFGLRQPLVTAMITGRRCGAPAAPGFTSSWVAVLAMTLASAVIWALATQPWCG